jgi:hypothetical protein
MRNLILGALLLLSVLTFGQKKEPVIYKKHSVFEKETSYSGTAGSLGIYAIKKDGDSICSYRALSVTIYDSYLTYAKDMKLLFSDGTTLELSTDEKLGDYNSKYRLYEYYATAYPSDEEWKLIKSKKIIGVNFYIFERKYNHYETLIKVINKIPLNID